MLTEELDKIEEKVDDELGEDVIEEVKKKIKDQSEALLASSLARDKKVSRDESGGNFEEDEEGGLEGENKDKEDEAEKESASDDSENKKTKDKEARSDSSGEETGDDKSFGNEPTQNKDKEDEAEKESASDDSENKKNKDKEDETEKESASDDSESKKEAELQVNKKKDKNKDAGKVKGGISQESDKGTSGMAKSLKKLLKTAWQNIIDSFGLTLLYIYAHWFWSQVFPKLFCDLGQEWVPEEISKASPEKAKEIGKKIGCIEKSLVGCTCFIISIVIYPILTITITVIWKLFLEPFGIFKLIFEGFKIVFDLF
ncbi:MAG: hypothetical protein ACOXZ1_03350 [Patescibacteria group bacterium]|jgi:tetrahydromethanopterin S-methyltransferase subunit G